MIQIEPVDRARARVLHQLRANPLAVELAGAGNPPLDGGLPSVLIATGARPAESVDYNLVSPAYFPILDVPIVRGRNSAAGEARARAPLVIVSQGAAEHFWPGHDPIGQNLMLQPTAYAGARMSPYYSARVIGVSANVTPGWIGRAQTQPLLYYPQPIDSARLVLVRAHGDADVVLAALDHALLGADSAAVAEMHTLDSARALQVYPFLAAYWCASMLGGIALLLTITGVYSVLSYLVAQRAKEFGIRMALGASPPTLIALVLHQSLRLALAGIGVGALLALAASRLIGSVVFIFDPYDAAGYAGGVAVVLAVCLIAAYVPSRRAAMADPVIALRAD